jgi:hypothetical protein
VAACIPFGRGGAASDHRHAEAAGAVGVALGHGDRVVLVARAVEADAGAVEGRGKHRRVVAHQAEHLLDAQRLDVLDQHLIGRRATVVMGLRSLRLKAQASGGTRKGKHHARRRVHRRPDSRDDELPDPTPGPGEVVLEMKASGMCGSDLHQYRRPKNLVTGTIAGHEPCGVVVAVGPGVPDTEAEIGDRMMVHHYQGCTHAAIAGPAGSSSARKCP